MDISWQRFSKNILPLTPADGHFVRSELQRLLTPHKKRNQTEIA